jgi:elongation factor 1-alpha
MADYALILVNARHPPTHMTAHHMNICAAFGIPIIVLLTKIDGCPKHAFKETMDEIRNMVQLPNIGKKPFAIRNETDIETIKDKLQIIAPIMSISAVTGEGLDILQKLLHSLPKRRHHQKKLVRPFEFLVDGIFNVQGVGCVVSGFVNAGSVSLGDMIYVGPFDDGTFIKTTVKGFHIARTSVNFISAGVSACIAIPLNKIERKRLRNGMVVLPEAVSGVRTFEAEVCVLKGGNSKTFQVGSETVVHVLNVKQTATVQKIELINNDFITSSLTAKEDNVVLRPGNRAKIVLRFKIRPEYVRTGMRIVFRDHHVSGVGIITGIQ